MIKDMFNEVDKNNFNLVQTQQLLAATNAILWAVVKRQGGIVALSHDEIKTAQDNIGNFSCDLKSDGSLEMIIAENMKGTH